MDSRGKTILGGEKITVFNWYFTLEFSFSELRNFSEITDLAKLKTLFSSGTRTPCAVKMRQKRGWEAALVVLLAAHASHGITLVAKGNKMAGATPLPDPHARGCFRRLKRGKGRISRPRQHSAAAAAARRRPSSRPAQLANRRRAVCSRPPALRRRHRRVGD